MLQLPENTRVRILEGPRSGTIGILVEDNPEPPYLVDVGYEVIIPTDEVEALTVEEEDDLIAKARGNVIENSRVESRRRGRPRGTKNKPKPAPQERPAEEVQTEPMQIHPPTPVVGRIEQLDSFDQSSKSVMSQSNDSDTGKYDFDRAKRAIEREGAELIVELDAPEIVPLSPPLLIIVQPNGTTVLSTPVTKDNVTGIIRSLIDLVA